MRLDFQGLQLPSMCSLHPLLATFCNLPWLPQVWKSYRKPVFLGSLCCSAIRVRKKDQDEEWNKEIKKRKKGKASVTLTHKPAVVTFLHDIDNVTVPQFQLIIVLRSIAVEGLVANSKTGKILHISYWISLTSIQKEMCPFPFLIPIIFCSMQSGPVFSIWEMEANCIKLAAVRRPWQ